MVEVEVEMVSVDEPEPPLTAVGLKVPFAPAGNPLTLKLTVPLNPLEGVTVAVKLVLLPATTDCEAGVAERVKPGTAVAGESSTRLNCWLAPPLAADWTSCVPTVVPGTSRSRLLSRLTKL